MNADAVRLPFLPQTLREPQNAWLAIAVGWLTAFLPSILLAGAVGLFLPDMEKPQIEVTGAYVVFLLVVFAPVVETLIMAGVLSLLLRLLPATAAVIASAAGWGIAHSLIASAWGLVIWWPFLVFSTLYVTWRRRSLAAALAIPAAVHALQNVGPSLLVSLG